MCIGKQRLSASVSNFKYNKSEIRGTAIYVKSDITSAEVNNTLLYKDQIWVAIFLKNKETLLLGCIYRSPTTGNSDTIKSLKEMKHILGVATKEKTLHLLIQ